VGVWLYGRKSTRHQRVHASSISSALGATTQTRLRRYRVQLASQPHLALILMGGRCAQADPYPDPPPSKGRSRPSSTGYGEGAHHPSCYKMRSRVISIPPASHSANTSRTLALNSGARAGPFPFFRPSRKRRWSAGRRHRRIAAGWRTQIRGPPRATAGPLLPGVAAFGRAGPVTSGPAPPGAPTRCRCRTPHPAPSSNVVDDALD
jgi:hypothetical protein